MLRFDIRNRSSANYRRTRVENVGPVGPRLTPRGWNNCPRLPATNQSGRSERANPGAQSGSDPMDCQWAGTGRTAHQLAVVSGTRTPQPACPQKVGGSCSVVRTVDTASESPAPLSSSSLLRHSSFIIAVCVNALVRICAGGDQRWSSLLRQVGVPSPDAGRLRGSNLPHAGFWLTPSRRHNTTDSLNGTDCQTRPIKPLSQPR